MSTPRPLVEALREARAIVASAAGQGGPPDDAGRAVLRAIDGALAQLEAPPDAPRRDLLSVVCHDLKEPLASIVMGVGFLKKALPEGDAFAPMHRVVDAIRRSSERMNHLIVDLYDLGKLEEGQVRLQPTEVGVRALLTAARDAALPAARERGASVTLDEPLPEGTIHADRARLLQALGEIVANAVRFSQGGGIVRLGAAEGEAGTMEITVVDQGCGIPPERLPTVFDRDANARQIPRHGPGLGLPIARALVTLHGGDVTLTSASGRGTRAVVRVPIR